MGKTSYNAGIWLDQRNAIIMKQTNGNESILHVISDVEEGQAKGGACCASIPYGPQAVISEKHFRQRKKQQLKDYYTKILSYIGQVNRLLIMGPAESKSALVNEIKNNNNLKNQHITLERADYMTEPQIIARIKHYFSTVQKY